MYTTRSVIFLHRHTEMFMPKAPPQDPNILTEKPRRSHPPKNTSKTPIVAPPKQRDIGHQRLQFDFTDTQVEVLDELQKDCGASSRAEIVRRAIAVLAKIKKAEKEGGCGAIQNANGTYIHFLLI